MLKRLAVSFTNLGPYHAARLRGLAAAAGVDGWEVVAIETAATERKYPWEVAAGTDGEGEAFRRVTLFPGRALEEVSAPEARRAMRRSLEAVRPDAVAVAGYVRPECLEAARWAREAGCPCVLMSESQAIDRPRVWWKERIKRARVRRFDAGLVGGPRHREYLVELGMDRDRIALGYNAVDHEGLARAADRVRDESGEGRRRGRPYFLTVCRLAEEKGLDTLLAAFAAYRSGVEPGGAWDLVICGGGPLEGRLKAQATALGVGDAMHWPGFLGLNELVGWYAGAGGFVLASRSEPWGLVVNEAAACGAPLIVSEAAGCVETLVPVGDRTGYRFEPGDVRELAGVMGELASLDETQRRGMGQRAREVAGEWGPSRFGRGLLEAIAMGKSRRCSRRRTQGRRLREGLAR